MTWRTRLLPASFRGVAFFVDRHQREGGRRLAVHEYPLRDEPYAEDLGRTTREFSLEAVLIGPAYDTGLLALHRALEASGPGLLTHPIYGLQSVCVQRFRTSVSSQEGGMARLSIDFVDAGRNAFPLSLLDSLKDVAARAAAVLDQVMAGLALGYMVLGLPSLVAQGARAVWALVLDAIEGLGAQLGLSATDRASQVQGLGTARRDLDRLTVAPALVGALVAGQVSALRTLAGAPWPAYQGLMTLTTWGADLAPVTGTTPARLRQAANQTALVGAVRDCALAQACLAALNALAAGTDGPAVALLGAGIPATATEIRALRTTLLGAIDVRQADAGDALYEAWADLRQSVAVDLEQRALAAPSLRALVPTRTEPALVLAYRLYADAGRAAEVCRRNRVRHPGFVPGGQVLEVRSV